MPGDMAEEAVILVEAPLAIELQKTFPPSKRKRAPKKMGSWRCAGGSAATGILLSELDRAR